MRSEERLGTRWRYLFWLPEPVYYWLLDRFTNNNSWRPLRHRYPEHFGRR